MAAPMDRTFSHLYEVPGAFELHGMTFADLMLSFGHGVATAQDLCLARLSTAAVRTPIVLAVLTQDDADNITIVHAPHVYPASLAGPTPMDGHTYAIHGNQDTVLAAVGLAGNSCGRPTPLVLDDHTVIRAALTAINPFVALPLAGAGVTAVRVRRVMVLPVEWARRAISVGSFSPAAFYDEFLAPAIGTGDEALYDEVFTWWRAAATHDAALAPCLSIAGTGLGLAQRATLTNWLSRIARLMIDTAIPFTADPLTNATFAATLTTLTDRMEAHNVATANRELARAADQTFEGRYSAAVRDEMLNITGAVDEDHFPALLRQLAKHKKSSEDIPFLRAAIDVRANNVACLADDHTKPKLTTNLLSMLRDWRLVAAGEELTSGLSPFAIVCAGHADAKKASDKVDSQLRLEQASLSLTLADANEFLIKDTRLPVDEHDCFDRLQGHSLLIDLLFGDGHVLAVAYRDCLTQVGAQLRSGLKVHYRESPGKRLHIALRVMYWICAELFYYISQKVLGNDPPLPDFAGLIKMSKVKSFETFLPTLPEDWLVVAPAPAPLNGAPTPAPAAGGPPRVRVSNDNPNTGLTKRFKASGHTTVNDMLKVAKDAGKTVRIPAVGDDPVCLAYHLAGRCWGSCKRAATHKFCAPATAKKVHELMDLCGVAPLAGASSE